MFYPGFWDIACLNEYLKYELSLDLFTDLVQYLYCWKVFKLDYQSISQAKYIALSSQFLCSSWKARNTNCSDCRSQIFFLRKWIIGIFQ